MKQLEIIELRTAGRHRAQVEQGLAEMTAGLDTTLQSITVYRNLTVATDWSIHLSYQSQQEENCKSPLGLRLAAALKEYGLVYHSVWGYQGGIK